MDMPSLRDIGIYLKNTGAGPAVPRDVWLNLKHRGHSERWRLTYEVDRRLQRLINCTSDNTSEVTKTIRIDRGVPLPILVARRELTGTSVDLDRYIITLTHDASPCHSVVTVMPTVYRC
ncbi:hypothetical protein MTO96_025887 [Rhipicephalus appendiculatus]